MALSEAAGRAIIHAIMRFISVACVALVIGSIAWSVYVTFIKPHTNPTKTTSQTADNITNIEQKNYYGIFHFKLGPFEFGF